MQTEARSDHLGNTDTYWSSTWHYYCIDHSGIAATWRGWGPVPGICAFGWAFWYGDSTAFLGGIVHGGQFWKYAYHQQVLSADQ